jgi:hypothetical protein
MAMKYFAVVAGTIGIGIGIGIGAFVDRQAIESGWRQLSPEYRFAALGSFVILVSVIGILWFICTQNRLILAALQQRKDAEENVRRGGERARRRESEVSDFIKEKSKTLEGIENKIDQFLRDHPWIAGITDNGLLPNVPLCGLILSAAQEYFRDSDQNYSCTTEYIYSWFRPSPEKADARGSVTGTLDEFQDLIDFCQHTLRNEGLAFEILRKAIEMHPSGIRLAPLLCRMAVTRGDVASARRSADMIESVINWPEISRLFSWRGFQQYWFPKREHRFLSKNVSFIHSSSSALALFYAAAGDLRRETRYSSLATSCADQAGRHTDVIWYQFERNVFAGRRQEADELLPQLIERGELPHEFAYLGEVFPELRVRFTADNRVAG